jgi:4-amino-4-deoxy-L-arabinose transferase-like glycosyltransferase
VRAIRLPRWRAFWRSPEDQPPWARPALLAIAGVAAVLYGWRIRDGGFASYYSLAVKSMSVSWKAFFYGALDPGATITIDKLAGSFAPQAISARIFGYHPWSVILPQVIEGVIAVLVMYRIGRRFAGPAAGLLTAGLFGLTPVVASMFGHAMEDGLLTLCLVLAADAFQLALMSGRLGPLVLSGVWVGLGFQAKMLQAWLILPAMAVTFVVAAPGGWRRRFGHLGVAGAVALVVSLSWVALYEATPDSHRPYVDGSTNNSAVAMVFGYNGLDRFGLHVPGAVRGSADAGGTGDGSSGADPAGGQGADPAGGQGGGQEQSALRRTADGEGTPEPRQQEVSQEHGGVSKLLGARYGSQIGWLYPLAFLGLILGLIARGRAPRTDAARAGYLFWGLWLVTLAAVFGNMTIAHQAYLSSLAPPLAVLSAAAVVHAWRGLLDRDAPWQLPVLVLAELGWTAYLGRQFPDFLPGLLDTVIVAGIIALLVIAAAFVPRVPRPGRLVLTSATALAVAAMVTVPSAWAGSVLDGRYAGDAFEASAGPRTDGLVGGAGNDLSPTGRLTVEQRRLDDYLTTQRDRARFVVAIAPWFAAAPYIAATGHTYLPMGGNFGIVPQPTLADVERWVGGGELRYFLLPAHGFGGFGEDAGGTGTMRAIQKWVTETCQVVTGDVAPPDQLLYRCE